MAFSQDRIRSLLNTLKSPRFAAWLIAALSLYLIIGSIFPQRDLNRAAYAQWAADNPTLSSVTEALGLDAPFVHPVFLAIIALVTISTILCSIQRTERAIRIYRSVGMLGERKIAAICRNPRFRFAVDPAHAEELYDRAVDSLRGMGLRSAKGPTASMGFSGAWGLMGSPVFHWSLVALFIVVSGGMLTRSEGLMGIVVGQERLDVEESYGLLQRGPLHGGMSGMTIGVEEDMPVSYVLDGIDRGPAPEVYLMDGDRELARSKVFPNHPLRYSTYLIHLSNSGLGLVTTVVSQDGAERSSQVFIDRDPQDPTVWGTASEIFLDDQGAEVANVTFATEPGTQKVRVDIKRADGTSESLLMGVGDTTSIKDGYMLRVDHLGVYVRLSVVDDWSLPYIYFLFTLATVAVGISVLVPYRGVWIALDRSGDNPTICVAVSHSRGDSAFVDRVAANVEQALQEVRS